jgi:GNAT superfamily N-acetyltransferase
LRGGGWLAVLCSVMTYRKFLPWMADSLGDRCRRGRHVLRMPGLRLQSPAVGDHNGALAGASDPEAQRWLEWQDESLVPAGKREQFLSVRPGTGLLMPPRLELGFISLAAIDPVSDRLAGHVSVHRETREVGGWLVPEYRSRGLGAALFAAAAELAHRHRPSQCPVPLARSATGCRPRARESGQGGGVRSSRANAPRRRSRAS